MIRLPLRHNADYHYVKTLFDCAKNAGVKKIVQVSVTNPSEEDPLPYYKGKANQEKTLRDSGVEYAIVRPTLVFGKEDISRSELIFAFTSAASFDNAV